MKERIILLFRYYIFWIIYFFIGRILFIIYNNKKIESFYDVIKSFYYGFIMDLSVSSYIMLLTGLIFATSVFYSINKLQCALKYMSFFICLFFSIITVSDLELYKNWGFRIDSTIFLYIKSPKEALSSTSYSIFSILLVILLIYNVITFYLFKIIVYKKNNFEYSVKWYFLFFFIIFSAFTIIPIRGGIKLAPLNIGAVYYSKNQFSNHSSINPIWNFLKSIIDNEYDKESILFYEDSKAHEIFNRLKEEKKVNPDSTFLKISRPNIIILVLESLSFNCMKSLGGNEGITPNMDELVKEGIFFENCIANGDRTDKGIVAILSGYPSLPVKSILKNVKKLEKLPNLGREFDKIGYSRTFYYGGDINFVNMGSYLMLGGFDNLVTDEYFPKKNQTSWGAYDQYVFDKLFQDVNTSKKPFFKVLLTITNHEPFKTPKDFKRKFEDANDEYRYLNTANYMDYCIGDFIEKSKKQSWYDSTLIVLVSDHGHIYPNNKQYNSLEKFRIPMLWIGGALKEKNVRIKNYFNQSDLAMLLGGQLGLRWDEEFPFSKDIIRNKENFGVYSFNNGIAFFNNEDGFIWDIGGNRFILKPKSNMTEEKGKAFFQILIKDYDSK